MDKKAVDAMARKLASLRPDLVNDDFMRECLKDPEVKRVIERVARSPKPRLPDKVSDPEL